MHGVCVPTNSCLQLCCDAADIISETFTARNGDDKGAKFAADGARLDSWFAKLESSLKFSGVGDSWFFGTEPSYADFAVYGALVSADFMLGSKYVAALEKAPKVKAWKGRFEARDNVAVFLASDRNEPALFPSIKAEESPASGLVKNEKGIELR
jgi:glutathione S-transferase